MKNIFLIFAAFLFIPSLTFAQSDTTKVKYKVKYTEESAENSDFKLKETYNYLIRAQVEEKTLFKIGLNGFATSKSGSYLKYTIGFEQKIKPAFSVLVDFQHTLEHDNPIKENAKYSFNAGARYYYNINSRIRKGKSANNFSANYLGIYQQNMLFKKNEDLHYQSNTNFLYGIQRRISKYGYVDFGFGPVLQNSSEKNRVSFNVLFAIGLAL